MKWLKLIALGGLAIAAAPLKASSPLSIIAIVEKVVFEPEGEAPETARVFGAFAFYDGYRVRTDPARGYLRFSLPAGEDAGLVRREWTDLAAVAGSGEAVAFARYGFLGTVVYVPGKTEAGAGARVPLRVHPADDATAAPVVEYLPAATGVVRLGKGNHDEIVAMLRALLAPEP